MPKDDYLAPDPLRFAHIPKPKPEARIVCNARTAAILAKLGVRTVKNLIVVDDALKDDELRLGRKGE